MKHCTVIHMFSTSGVQVSLSLYIYIYTQVKKVQRLHGLSPSLFDKTFRNRPPGRRHAERTVIEAMMGQLRHQVLLILHSSHRQATTCVCGTFYVNVLLNT